MRKSLSLIGGIGLGISLSQFPEYTQQYEQRLGGAVDELRAIVSDFDASAVRAGLSREEALAVYDEAGHDFLVDRGRDMRTVFARYERLSAHMNDIANASSLERLTDMARYYDPEIGARALEAYSPAVPVTPEGLTLGGAGVVAGYGILAAIFALVRRPFRRRRNA